MISLAKLNLLGMRVEDLAGVKIPLKPKVATMSGMA